MSFFKKKMSQNDWATIMPFGPVTLIFYWPKQIFSGQPKEGWPSFQALHYVIKFVSDFRQVSGFLQLDSGFFHQ